MFADRPPGPLGPADLVRKLQTERRPAIVDIGASKRRRGTITLDMHPFDGVDVVHDITQGMPFEDNSLDGVAVFHVIEHLPADQFERFFLEVWRCCKSDARVEIRVPHFSCGLVAWSDPTHIRPYSADTFTSYLCGSERLHFNSRFPVLPAFKPESVSLRYYAFREERKVKLRGLGTLIESVANRSIWMQRQFERRLCYLLGGFEEVEAVLRVVKPRNAPVLNDKM